MQKTSIILPTVKSKRELLTETTLLPLRIAIDEAQTTLTTLQRDKEKLVMDLDKKLGLDISQPLTLKNEAIPQDEFSVADVDKLVADVVSTAHSVTKLQNDKMLSEKEHEYPGGLYNWRSSGYSGHIGR